METGLSVVRMRWPVKPAYAQAVRLQEFEVVLLPMDIGFEPSMHCISDAEHVGLDDDAVKFS